MSYYRERATEILTEKLLDGGAVNGLNIRDLLDDICQGKGNESRYHTLLEIMENVASLACVTGDEFLLRADSFVTQLTDLVVKPYIEDQDIAISDLERELKRAAEEDEAYERSAQ